MWRVKRQYVCNSQTAVSHRDADQSEVLSMVAGLILNVQRVAAADTRPDQPFVKFT
jgi:hypothetical protein